MLLPRDFHGLAAQHVQRTGDAQARMTWADHLVDVTALGGHERIGEAVLILGDFL